MLTVTLAPTAALLNRLVQWLRRFLVLTPAQEIVIALWIMHTHAIDAADFTPYLHITAPEKGCGKTRLLEVLQPIVRHPWLTGRVTPGALVRKIAKDRPTLLLDESDAAFNGETPYTEALRGILNSGFHRNGATSQCTGKGAEMTTQDFGTFCPKAIAGIGHIPDTVESRSIVIQMRRKKITEQVERFRDRDVRQPAMALRLALEEWATTKTLEILHHARPPLPEGLSDRQQDISEPLLALADLGGAGWPDRARVALLELFDAGASEDRSEGVQLLADIRGIFDAKSDERIFSSDLANCLNQMEGRTWPDMSSGRGITPNQVARRLKPYGITPSGTVRIGELTRKGYIRNTFEEAWMRYCAPTPIKAVTSVTHVTTRVNISDFSMVKTPQNGHAEVMNRHGDVFPSSEEQDGEMADVTASNRHTLQGAGDENPRQSGIVTAVTGVTAFSTSNRFIVKRVFEYYLEQTNRIPEVYTLTEARMRVGTARLEDCLKKTGGDINKAEDLMRLAVESLAESGWHKGKNPDGKQYLDWVDHLFGSTEKLEKWLC